MNRRFLLFVAMAMCALLAAPDARGTQDAKTGLLSIDHYVRVKSTVPSIAGQIANIGVPERVHSAPALRGSPAADRVVLFVHGAGTPAEVAFDTQAPGYSWMAQRCKDGF